MSLKEIRAEAFRNFLESNGYYIDYNGLQYTLATKDNQLITVTNTSDEMYSFIKGYNQAEAKYLQQIKALEERNLTNVSRYEGIIENLDGDKLPDEEE